jgi:hypothetical protein
MVAVKEKNPDAGLGEETQADIRIEVADRAMGGCPMDSATGL